MYRLTHDEYTHDECVSHVNEWAPQARVSPASLTKMMTALVILSVVSEAKKKSKVLKAKVSDAFNSLHRDYTLVQESWEV